MWAAAASGWGKGRSAERDKRERRIGEVGEEREKRETARGSERVSVVGWGEKKKRRKY